MLTFRVSQINVEGEEDLTGEAHVIVINDTGVGGNIVNAFEMTVNFTPHFLEIFERLEAAREIQIYGQDAVNDISSGALGGKI